jgi:hypothetical protein
LGGFPAPGAASWCAMMTHPRRRGTRCSCQRLPPDRCRSSSPGVRFATPSAPFGVPAAGEEPQRRPMTHNRRADDAPEFLA